MEQIQNSSVAKQRIVRTEEQILLILDEYERSGFTQKEFCEVSDINEVTFYSWLKKYRSKSVGEEVKGFTTIEVTGSFPTKPVLFAEIGLIKLYREVPAEYLKALMS